MEFTLVSQHLCPYVQRAAIVLAEKGVSFSRRWVDLAARPDWFAAVSPLGKTPVLLVDGEPIFESAVICEYLDEVVPPRLHPSNALERARHRGWMEVGSSVLDAIAGFYSAGDPMALEAKRGLLRARFAQVEQAISNEGSYFAGDAFSIVDAVFAPVFRYFDTLEAVGEADVFEATPRVRDWRRALAARPSVRAAAVADYPERLLAFLQGRDSELSRRIATFQRARGLSRSAA